MPCRSGLKNADVVYARGDEHPNLGYRNYKSQENICFVLVVVSLIFITINRGFALDGLLFFVTIVHKESIGLSAYYRMPCYKHRITPTIVAPSYASAKQRLCVSTCMLLKKVQQLQLTNDLLQQKGNAHHVNSMNVDIPPSITISVRRLLLPLGNTRNSS